jgi:hypothetical protein
MGIGAEHQRDNARYDRRRRRSWRHSCGPTRSRGRPGRP